MTSVLRCFFPFPDQDPPVEVSTECGACPNAPPEHPVTRLEVPPAELDERVRAFADRFFVRPDDRNDEYEDVVGYAKEIYTRPTLEYGARVPKTVLFAFYKIGQFPSYGTALEISEWGRAALDPGNEVASWPDGVPRRGRSWNNPCRL